jgi:uncharacterized membrane protein YhiD involved in acid resistance
MKCHYHCVITQSPENFSACNRKGRECFVFLTGHYNSYIIVIIHIILLLFVLQNYEMCGKHDKDEEQMHRSFVEISREKETPGWTENIAKESVENLAISCSQMIHNSVNILLTR